MYIIYPPRVNFFRDQTTRDACTWIPLVDDPFALFPPTRYADIVC